MSRRLTSILVAFVTVAGMATSLFAGGRVLCVGPGEHAEVEFRHATCPESGGHEHDHDSEGGQDCVDFEIAQDFGDHFGRGVSDVDVGCGWAWITFELVTGVIEVVAEPAVPPDEGPPDWGLRCVRSVVLLI